MDITKTMFGQDAISGAEGSAFVTIGDERYRFMQLESIEAEAKISIKEIGVLGSIGKKHKAGTWSGKWKAKAIYNMPIFRKMLLEYKRTGKLPYFDIQIVNDDPTSAAGRQTVLLKECLFEGGILAKTDANSEALEEDISGTFDDFEMPEQFSCLDGMRQ